MGGVWKKWQNKPEHSVSACLQQQSGKDQTTCRRCLGMSVRQPAMERHNGELYHEGRHKTKHQPPSRGIRKSSGEQFKVVEGVRTCVNTVNKIETQDGQ